MFEQLDEPEKMQPTEGSALCVCYDHERSTIDRPALWIPIIIVMFASFLFLLAIADLPYGIQLGSLIPYTAFVALGTFSAQRCMQPYFFECPIVQHIMARLLRRHGGFVAAIVLLESIALSLTRFMPATWLTANARDGSPFAISLCVICVVLGCIETFTNRSLLERAHATGRSTA
jgi:hypothetical protein